MYRYMEPSPRQGNQMPYYPGNEQFQKKIDPPEHPVMFEPWSSNYGHPYHGCCFPAYFGYRPPYAPHFAPPPAFHHWGNYPAFQEPVPYNVPPPPCTMERPRYEYYKEFPSSYYHCCGCPNHSCHGKNGHNFKVEEEKDAETGRSGGSEVVPAQPQKLTYPIVWIPPDYRRHEEDERKPSESEMRDRNNSVAKDSVPKQQNVSNGWRPIIWVPSNEKARNDQNEDQRESFPFPISWVPSNEKQSSAANQENQKDSEQKLTYPIVWIPPEYRRHEEEDEGKPSETEMRGRNNSVAKDSVPKQQNVTNGWNPIIWVPSNEKARNDENEDQRESFPFPIIWVPSNEKQSSAANQVNQKDSVASGNTVPVKSVSDEGVTKNPNSTGQTSASNDIQEIEVSKDNRKCIPVKDGLNEENGSCKDTRSNSDETTVAERQSSSPKKSSKLPPVCLRVDPLPKKKNSGSRSPSPPKASKEDSKTPPPPHVTQMTEVRSLNGGSCDDNSEPIKEVVTNNKVPEGSVEKDKPGNLVDDKKEASEENLTDEGHDKQMGESKLVQENSPETGACVKAVREPDSSDNTACECKSLTKKLSRSEAATLIQSAYRGYEVRRWEPLKKLRQIANIREQVMGVSNRIQALKSSSDLRADQRQKVIVGEMIMNLLLNLDTIQGLNPSIREARKSLARELGTLQERLDSIYEGQRNSSEATYPSEPAGDQLKEEASVDILHTAKDSMDNELEMGHVNSMETGEQKLSSGRNLPDNNNKNLPEPMFTEQMENESSLNQADPNEDAKNEACKASDQQLASCDVQGYKTLSEENKVPNKSDIDSDGQGREPFNSLRDDSVPVYHIEEENGLLGNSTLPPVEEEVKLMGELPTGLLDDETPFCDDDNLCQQREISDLMPQKEEEIKLVTELFAGVQNADPVVYKHQLGEHTQTGDARKDAEEAKTTTAEAASEILGGEVDDPKAGAEIESPQEVEAELTSMPGVEVGQQQEPGHGIAVQISGEAPSSESEKGSPAIEEARGNQEQQEHAKATDEVSDHEPSAHVTRNSGDLTVEAHSELQNCDGDEKLIEENKRLRVMMEKLMVVGKEQLDTISNLTGRVKDLEKKLSKRNNLKKPRRRRAPLASRHNTKLRTGDAAI